MKYRYCILMGLALLPLPLAVQAQPSFIVRLTDDAPAALVEAVEAGGAAKQGAYPALFDGVSRTRPVFSQPGGAKTAPFQAYVLSVPDSTSLAARLEAWGAEPGVAYVQPNRRYLLDAAEGPNDPMLDSLLHLPVIRAFDAWELTRGDPSVRVGLVDTGLYFEHPDLIGQVWINPGEDLNGNGLADPADFNGIDDDGNGFVDDIHGYDFVDRPSSVEPGDYRERDGDPSEDDRPGGGRGHGTLVAGVIAARAGNAEGIAGVAPETRLVPLRAFGADGVGEDDDVAAAIVYAAQMGLDALNLSFGDVYYSPLMHEAIQFAVAEGTVVVASGGNLGGDGPHYPSDYPEVVAVAWLTQDGTSIAGRGTYGSGIDLGAPGSSVFTTLMPRRDEDGAILPETRYGRRSGSSVAAPMVTAVVALLRALDPALTPSAIRAALTASARDVGEPGWDHRTGAGLLDAAAALGRALPARVAIDLPEQDGGVAQSRVPILGTVLDPAFASYEVAFAPGAEDPAAAWTTIDGPIPAQRLDDTLAVWQTGALPEGRYTLRLAATLRSGRTIEDRRRVVVDRTPPVLDARIVEVGLIGSRHGIVADVRTDDLTAMTMAVGGQSVESDRRARHHGLVWVDEGGRGGTLQVRLRAVNAAGLESVFDTTLAVPATRTNDAYFTRDALTVPHGYLLPFPTDFDGDGLLELVMNRYQDGWIGDTLAFYEWDGAGFRPAQHLIANVIPRDVGDPDGDGLAEVLTQVAGATLVLEQPAPGRYPSAVSFVDTTGLANPFADGAAFGARLTDLDADGRGEILVHNTRQWRLLEYDGEGYREVTRLDNPTGTGDSEIAQNEFQQPLVEIGDFDGDGHTDLLTGDGDGDWILYEAAGDDALRPVWTFETARYNAAARLTSGDFDGDGLPEFITFTQNWTQPTGEGEKEPDVGLYYFWDGAGDDQYRLVDRLPIPGPLSRHGTLHAADLDGDGRDELILIHAPELYVLAFDAAMHWRLVAHVRPPGEAGPAGVRSVAVTSGDFDGDGAVELIAAHADERLHRYRVQPAALTRPPPVWRHAYALDARRVTLSWHAPGADSVTVFRGFPGAALDPIRTAPDSTALDSVGVPVRYALRAWYGGAPSPLSDAVAVRPHMPAVVQRVVYAEGPTVELIFSEPLEEGLRAEQFRLDASGPAHALLRSRSGHSVVLRFASLQQAEDVLRWPAIADAEGTPVAQRSLSVSFPETSAATLFVAGWELLDDYAVLLRFNEPLDGAFAGDAANYRLSPSGRVVAAGWDPARPAEVVVRVEGRPLGATGRATTLSIVAMRSASGGALDAAGRSVLLSAAAADLAGAYVYPNPIRASVHPRAVIAGLPAEARVEVFTLHGEPIRRLEERDGDGGVDWDLRDAQGQAVPSGVYLVRIEGPGGAVVLRKAVVIR